MQTINYKRKYKLGLQQLFNMLSLSLNTGLGSFSPLVNGAVNYDQLEVSPDLNDLRFYVQVAYWLLAYALLHSAVVPWTPRRRHSTHIKLFKRSRSAIHSLKIIYNGPILMKWYQPVLGVRFFKHSLDSLLSLSCLCLGQTYSSSKAQLTWKCLFAPTFGLFWWFWSVKYLKPTWFRCVNTVH